MQNKKLIPSPLIRSEERSPIVIDDITDTSRVYRYRVIYFFIRFNRFLGRVLWLKLSGRLEQTTVGILLREMFQEMGVLWIKVGQLLSLRVDLLSKDLCDELSKLQDQAHGFSPVLARQILEEDLGAPIERYFDHFEKMPFAAASISQVHRAYLKAECAWVAIKIRKPDAQEIFARDMAILRWIINMFIRFSVKPYMRWDDMLWEIEQMIAEELDYWYEATNMRRMKKTLRRHHIYVPEVFRRYCTQRVLVMEYVQGVLMTDYLKIAHTDPERLARWRQQNNISPKKLGKWLHKTNLRQIYEDNLFHGDLHPGNIVLLRNSRFAFIDFGSIGSSDPDFLEKHTLYLEAITYQQFAKVFDLYMLFPDNIPNVDRGLLKEQFIRIFQSWHDRCRIKGLSYDEKSINSMNDEIIELLGHYQITMPWYFLRFMRAFSTLDAALRELIPRENINTLTMAYLKQKERRRLCKTLRKQRHKAPRNTLPADIIEAPITLHETMIFRGAIVRRMAQVFEGMTTKVTQGIDSVFRVMVLCVRVLILLLVLMFGQQYQVVWLTPFIHDALGRLLRLIPYLDLQIWLLVGGGMLYIERVLVNLRQRFRESEA